jgi:dethiobiotin synthetase
VNHHHLARIIFITGTDTGVGKTLLTGLLLQHLRTTGHHALAIKPFCSGTRADVDFLRAVQDGELTRDEVNPFFFAEPLAPLVAARKQHLAIRIQDVLRHVAHTLNRCECLLIEGSGGLLVPLGEGYSVADLIAKLNCEAIVVARNKLGTLNHTLLTVQKLQHIAIKALKVVIMDQVKPDPSSDTNPAVLAELLGPVPLVPLPFLGLSPARIPALKKIGKKMQKTLAQILS